REWLVSHMPARVRPPGDCAAYSNYGTALAGYIVARVSGQPYAHYIQEYILSPLGMVHATAQSPIPPHLHAHAATGYAYVDGALEAFPDYLGQPALVPGAGISASATDMARFMIAHLQSGAYADADIANARILKESTAQQMHSTVYAHDPRLLGTADRKSTRLNSSHVKISYAVFCLKKKNAINRAETHESAPTSGEHS